VKSSKSPSKKQLAEFDRFWEECNGPYLRMAYGKNEGQAKAELLAHYIWMWEESGCPKRFIPKPLPHSPVTFGSGRVDTEDKLANFDQDLYPNKDWNL
jgi:hypothetical protein